MTSNWKSIATFYIKKTLSYSEKVPTKLCSEVIRGRNQNAASRAASDDLGWPQWIKMKNLHIFSSVEVLFCAKCIEKMSKNTNSKFKNCPVGGGQNGGQNARSVKFFNWYWKFMCKYILIQPEKWGGLIGTLSKFEMDLGVLQLLSGLQISLQNVRSKIIGNNSS